MVAEQTNDVWQQWLRSNSTNNFKFLLATTWNRKRFSVELRNAVTSRWIRANNYLFRDNCVMSDNIEFLKTFSETKSSRVIITVKTYFIIFTLLTYFKLHKCVGSIIKLLKHGEMGVWLLTRRVARLLKHWNSRRGQLTLYNVRLRRCQRL